MSRILSSGGFNRGKKEVLYKIKRLFKTVFFMSEALVLLVGRFIRYLKFPLIAQINAEITRLTVWWEGRSAKICEQYSYMNFLPQAKISLWILILFSISGCEIYSDVLTKPEYQPSLTMHAILSPQEGGQVYIKYTKPVDSTNAQPVPLLPELSVFLYENGAKKYTFTESERGHFILDTAGMEIFPERDYHLKVEDKDGEIILKSGKDRLPSLPDILDTRFYQDTTTFPEKNYVDVEFNLTPDSETAYHFRKDYSIDSGQIFIQGQVRS